MIKFLAILFLNLIFGLLQTSFLGEIYGTRFVPNLILAFSFALMFNDLKDTSLMSAFIGGLILDFLGFNIVGTTALIFVGSLYISLTIRRYLSKGWVTNLSMFVLSLLIFDLVLGNFSNIILLDYTFYMLVMLLVVVFMYFLIGIVVDYLGKVGYVVEE